MSRRKKQTEKDYSPQCGMQEIMCFEPSGLVSLDESLACLERLARVLGTKKLLPVWRSSLSAPSGSLDRLYVAFNPTHLSAVRKQGQRMLVGNVRAINHRSINAIPLEQGGGQQTERAG